MWIRPVCLGILLTACCLAQSDTAVQKAALAGVVRSATGQPLRGVTLLLTPVPSSAASAPASSSATETDVNGNFAFDPVDPGRYLLSAEKSGYLRGGYGDRLGPVLTINAGDKVTDVAIEMSPQGIIAGRVMDADDQPVSGATVKLLIRVSGAPQPQSVAGTTDADGAFAIGSLLPGKYVVSVEARPNTGPPIKSPLETERKTYVTTYYPDATDFAAASPLDLAAGAQVRGLEIRLQKVPVFKLNGKVVLAETGGPGAVDKINLIRQGSEVPGVTARSTGTNAAGEFSFDGIVPGTYVLETTPVSAGDNGVLVGRQVVSIAGGDLDRVALELKPAIELRGKINVEASSPIAAWPQVALTPTEGLNYPDFAKVDGDGHFLIAALEPEPYRVNISSIPPNTFIKSVRFNGHDIADGPIDLAEASTASLDVVISDHASGSIHGVITDSDLPVGAGIAVVAFPARAPRVPRARTDANGRFSILHLPPGVYHLIAVDIPGFPALPPTAIERLGKEVVVPEDASVDVQLKLTTMEDFRALALP